MRTMWYGLDGPMIDEPEFRALASGDGVEK